MNNITIKKYSKNPDIKYPSLLKSMRPKNEFSGKEAKIGTLPYLEVVNWYGKLSKMKTFNDVCNLFKFVFNIEDNEFWNESIVAYFAAFNFIQNDFLDRQEKESKILKGSEVDKLKWKAAGGDSLKKFSPVSPLDEISQRYGGSPFEWGEKPYNEIIYLITMITRKANIS